jgi:hypothetical protein
MQQALNFGGISLGILPANAFTGDFAGQFMQPQRNGQALLASHATVSLDLFVQCHCRIHGLLINQFLASYNSTPVNALSEVVVTALVFDGVKPPRQSDAKPSHFKGARVFSS